MGADRHRPSGDQTPTQENPRMRGNGVYSHPKIIKEDAFFRLDTVSSTCGQVELRFWFAKIEKPRLDCRKRGREWEGGQGKASDETLSKP